MKRANMMVRKYRLKRHLVLALAAALLVAAFYEAVGFSPEPWTDIPDFKADDQIWRLSISLAYSTLIFLGAVLVIGPFYVLRGRSIPAGNNLRRDVGIWTAVLGLAPVVFGSVVHTREMPVLAAVSQVFWGVVRPYQVATRVKLQRLFLSHAPDVSHGWHALHPRIDRLGLAVYLGLLQASILVVLLATSNNYSLRRLGVVRWKQLHRAIYLLWFSLALHALLFQSLEARLPALRLGVGAVFLVVTGLQVLGFVRRRSRQRTG